MLPLAFIDRFTGDVCTNKVYKVEEALGAKKLGDRKWLVLPSS